MPRKTGVRGARLMRALPFSYLLTNQFSREYLKQIHISCGFALLKIRNLLDEQTLSVLNTNCRLFLFLVSLPKDEYFLENQKH